MSALLSLLIYIVLLPDWQLGGACTKFPLDLELSFSETIERLMKPLFLNMALLKTRLLHHQSPVALEQLNDIDQEVNASGPFNATHLSFLALIKVSEKKRARTTSTLVQSRNPIFSVALRTWRQCPYWAVLLLQHPCHPCHPCCHCSALLLRSCFLLFLRQYL